MTTLIIKRPLYLTFHAKRLALVFALFLPLVWFLPLITWADVQYWAGIKNPVTLASEMHRNGQRSALTIQAMPEVMIRELLVIERDNDCYMEDSNFVNLGSPPQFAGYETVLNCPNSPSPYIYVYFDEHANFLNSIPTGSD